MMDRGVDVLACAPTAFGKSLLYMLPALLTGGMVVAISPLVSLMLDQVATAFSSYSSAPPPPTRFPA